MSIFTNNHPQANKFERSPERGDIAVEVGETRTRIVDTSILLFSGTTGAVEALRNQNNADVMLPDAPQTQQATPATDAPIVVSNQVQTQSFDIETLQANAKRIAL